MAAFLKKAEKINASRNNRAVSPVDGHYFEKVSLRVCFRFEIADAMLNMSVWINLALKKVWSVSGVCWVQLSQETREPDRRTIPRYDEAIFSEILKMLSLAILVSLVSHTRTAWPV